MRQPTPRHKLSGPERMALDLRRQYLNDTIHSDVTFDAERMDSRGRWGVRVEYLWEDPTDNATKTGSWLLFASGVNTEDEVRKVIALLES